jgi:hypothetical protein
MGVSSPRQRWLHQRLCVSVTALSAANRLIQFGLLWRTSAVPFLDRAQLDRLSARPHSCSIATNEDDPFLQQTPHASSAAWNLLQIAQVFGREPACL